MDIISATGVGRENAVTRQQLCEKLGKSDRAVRQMIETARNEGALIINSQDGKGYFMAVSASNVLAQYNRNKARALSILMQQKHLVDAYVRLEGEDQTLLEGF